jgi:hypothetical protein
MIRKIAAAVGISAALALGAAGVAFADAQPVAQISEVANADCTYTVTASVAGWSSSDSTEFGAMVGEDGSVVLSDTDPNADYGGPVPLSQLDPSDIWSTTTATSSDWFRVTLYEWPGPVAIPGSTVSLWLSGYQCVVATPTPAATAPPTATPVPTAGPTDTPTATAVPTAPSGDATAHPTAIPVGTGSQGGSSGSGGSQGQGRATLPPTGSASSTATPGAAPTDTPSATASPTDTPSPTPDAGLAPASAHTPTSGGDGLLLILLVAAFFVVCGAAAFGGAYLRRRST